MPRKTKEESIKTRSLLLEAALDVFSEKSFSEVTLSEIAERVGMTKGALYWHFKNKSDLLSKLIKEICLDSESEFTEKFGTPETLADLREYYRKKLVPPDRNDRFMKIHAIMLRRFEWPEDVRSNAFSLLKDIKKNQGQILEATHKIGRLESEGDRVYRHEVAYLFDQVKDPIELIKWKDVLEYLEDTLDHCEDVSDMIRGVVMKYA